MDTTYLPCWQRRDDRARVRLFCLPHAGAGAGAYRAWTDLGSPDVGVQPVQLPGRDSLAGTALIDDLHTLVSEHLGPAIAQADDLPFVLLGHSMGAALAAEITAFLLRQGHRPPELLIVSAYRGGDDSSRWLPGSSDEELLQDVLSMGGTDPELFSEPSMRQFFLETMRNDIEMLRGYRRGYRRLQVPLLALGGEDDQDVPEDELALWSKRTTVQFTQRMWPGGHFYLHEQPAEVIGHVLETLGQLPASTTHFGRVGSRHG